MLKRLPLVACLALVPGFAPAANASLITVNTTVDEFNATPSTGCSLREAIHAANTNQNFGGCASGQSGGDLILMAAGTYTLTRSPTNPDDGSTGDLHITEELQIISAGVIDAGDLDRVFEIEKSAGLVTLTGLTLRNGDPDGLPNLGGAILTHESVQLVLDSVTIESSIAAGGGAIALLSVLAGDPPTAVPTFDFVDVTLIENEATQFGGAVNWSSRGSGASWDCLRCILETNVAGVGGGAIEVNAPDQLAALEFEDSFFSDNSTSNALGGGIHLPASAAATVRLTNVEMHGNQGIGQYRDGFYSESPLATLFTTGGSISDTLYFADGGAAVLSGTTLANGSFGALFSFRDTMVEATDVRFENNVGSPTLQLGEGSSAFIQRSLFAGSLEGAIDCYDCDLTVLRSAFVNNVRSGVRGGAIRVRGTAAEAAFRNVTFSGNQTLLGASGGALALVEGADFSLNNVTIAYNQDGGGGALYVGNTAAPPEVANSIIAGNTNDGLPSDCAGTIVSIGYNLIGNADDCSYSPTAGDQSGTVAQPLAADLAPLGVVNDLPVHGLLLGSPALDAADNGSCEAVDQVGQSRPLDGGGGPICDIGAREEPSPGEPALFQDGFETGDLSAW